MRCAEPRSRWRKVGRRRLHSHSHDHAISSHVESSCFPLCLGRGADARTGARRRRSTRTHCYAVSGVGFREYSYLSTEATHIAKSDRLNSRRHDLYVLLWHFSSRTHLCSALYAEFISFSETLKRSPLSISIYTSLAYTYQLAMLPRLSLASTCAARAAPPRAAASSLAYAMALDGSHRLTLSRDRKTKIVATLGPSSSSAEQLKPLLYAGLDVARINCAHGDKESYAAMARSLRTASAEVSASADTIGVNASAEGADGAASRPDVGVAALGLDIKGPEIRVGRFAGGGPLPLARGTRVLLTTNASAANAGSLTGGVYVSYPHLARDVSPGTRIFVDDGNVELEVESADASAGTVIVRALTDAPLLERKGVNIIGVSVDLPAVTRKDEVDIATARELGADFVFASFVQSAAAVRQIRAVIGAGGPRIIAKIESQEGVDAIDEILEAADGIMVARGDLGVQIPPERVFLAQKRLVARANAAGKPVICATQMLESMTAAPRPTRAECVDVASAVLDGCDAVMLSGETAKGRHPVAAVQMMARICRAAEAAYPHRRFFEELTELVADRNRDSVAAAVAAAAATSSAAGSSSPALLGSLDDSDHMAHFDLESLASAAVHAAFEVDAAAIVVVSVTGHVAELIAKYRPHCPVLAVTSSHSVARLLQLQRGVHAVHAPEGASVFECQRIAVAAAKAHGIARAGQRIVYAAGAHAMPGQPGLHVSLSHVL